MGEVEGTGGRREGPSPAKGQAQHTAQPASLSQEATSYSAKCTASRPGFQLQRCNPAASVTLATSPSSQASALPVRPRTREDRVCEATDPGAPLRLLGRPRTP